MGLRIKISIVFLNIYIHLKIIKDLGMVILIDSIKENNVNSKFSILTHSLSINISNYIYVHGIIAADDCNNKNLKSLSS